MGNLLFSICTFLLLRSAIAGIADYDGCFEYKTRSPKNCEEVQLTGIRKSGYFTIYPNGPRNAGVEVYCDLESGDGAWTVIQKRNATLSPDIAEDFYRNWNDYARGFGRGPSFWIGLNAISSLTSKGNMQLRIDMMDWEDEKRFAFYGSFHVANANQMYKLTVSNYSGNAGDYMSWFDGMKFTTRDKDNDIWSGNCAVDFKGAWWYNRCGTSLNGRYNGTGQTGVAWYTWRGLDYSMKHVEMKIRSAEYDDCVKSVVKSLCLR